MKVTLIGSFNDFYLQRPLQLHSAQAVVAGNSHEEQPIPETFCQSVQKTMQQRILDDVVTLYF